MMSDINEEQRDKLTKCFRKIFSAKYARNDNIPCKIEEGLFLGSVGAAYNKEALKSSNITHVLVVAKSLKQAFPNDFVYKMIEVLDTPMENLEQHFDDCIDFIEQAKDSGGSVLVHCFAGISRSATIVVSYLMKKHQISALQAIDLVRRKRPKVSPNSGFFMQLKNFEKSIQGESTLNMTFQKTLDGCTAPFDPATYLPRLGGIFKQRLAEVRTLLTSEDEYVRLRARPPLAVDLDLHHHLLQLSVLSQVRLEQGGELDGELQRVRADLVAARADLDALAAVRTELDAVKRERDLLAADVCRAAEEEKVRAAAAEKVVKDVQAAFVKAFLPAFKDRLADLKRDHAAMMADSKRSGFWKGYVHGRQMSSLVYPPLSHAVVPRSRNEWAGWEETGVPTYQPPVDVSDSEEQDLEADFPDYWDPLLD